MLLPLSLAMSYVRRLGHRRCCVLKSSRAARGGAGAGPMLSLTRGSSWANNLPKTARTRRHLPSCTDDSSLLSWLWFVFFSEPQELQWIQKKKALRVPTWYISKDLCGCFNCLSEGSAYVLEPKGSWTTSEQCLKFMNEDTQLRGCERLV